MCRWAECTYVELRVRFALGNLAWLLEGKGTAPARPSRPARTPTLAEWVERWLEGLHEEIEESSWRTYAGDARDLARRLGEYRLDQITPSHVDELRRTLRAEGKRDRTIRNKVMTLGTLYRDARVARLVDSSPTDTPHPRRRTKRTRHEAQSKRVTFTPLRAEELLRLMEALKTPETRRSSSTPRSPNSCF